MIDIPENDPNITYEDLGIDNVCEKILDQLKTSSVARYTLENGWRTEGEPCISRGMAEIVGKRFADKHYHVCIVQNMLINSEHLVVSRTPYTKKQNELIVAWASQPTIPVERSNHV